MVHYNGFVFGSNYLNMMIIRERESKIIDFKDKDLSLSSSEDLNL